MISLPTATTNGPPGRTHLSYSAVSLYRSCSLRYFFRYVVGLPETTVSASLVLGSRIHASIQHWYEQLLIGQKTPSLDTLLDVFWTDWNARREEATILFNKGEDVSSIATVAERLLRTFVSSELAKPKGIILGVEEELRGRLLADVPEFLARVDLIVENDDCVSITDFKTARSSWSQEHVRDSAEQLLLYHELARPLGGGKPIKLQFAVLTKTKIPQLAVHEVRADPQKIQRTKRIVEKVWHSIAAENYYPSPSPIACGVCPYREPCREWTG